MFNIKKISKLNRDTKEGLVKWEIDYSRATDLFESDVYICKFFNKELRLYKQSDSYCLEIAGSKNIFKDDHAIHDLYDTVVHKILK